MMIKLKINTGALKAAQNTQSWPGTPASAAAAGGGGGAGSASSPPPQSTPTTSGGAAPSPSTVPKIRFKNLKPPTASSSTASPSSSSKLLPTPASKPAKPASRTGSSSSSSTTKPRPIINTSLPLLDTPPTPLLKTPKLKLKPLPTRPKKRPFSPGLGYDSEASDREDDPLIEEQFILRMPPGPDCTYLRHLIETKTLDTSSDVFFKFVSPRTAVVGVRGNLYSALLVDLPCILESVKTLDKKNVFKTADVCQMLLVGEKVRSEEEVRMPTGGDGERGPAGKGDLGGGWKTTDIIYPHGITPPLQFVRKRRFRKRVSNRTIEAVEAEVDRLLAMDQDAESSKYEVLDAEQLLREEEAEERRARDGGGSGGTGAYGVGGNVAMAGDGYNDEDAEGEEDYDMDEDDLALQMESALMGGEDVDAEGDVEIDESAVLAALSSGGATIANPPTTTITTTTTTNTTPSSSTTPTNLTAAAATESDDEEDEEDDASAASASDVEGEIDESAQETAAQSQKIREEIADLEAAYKSGLREMEKVQNPIMRARKQAALERIVKELEFKMSTLGGGGVGGGAGVGNM